MSNDSIQATHRTTARVLQILEAVAGSEQGISMADISRQLGIPKGSLSPILHTMVLMGYVKQLEGTKRYVIGLHTFLLGRAFGGYSDTMQLLTEIVQQVTDACSETSQIGRLDHGRVLYVAKADSPQPVRLSSSIGKTLPVHCTAIGKALISEMDERDVREMMPKTLERVTEHTLDNVDELLTQLSEVRSHGIAYDHEEVMIGVQCIAVPVRQNGIIAYGIGVSVPSYRLSKEKQGEVIQALREARDHLEEALS